MSVFSVTKCSHQGFSPPILIRTVSNAQLWSCCSWSHAVN